MLTVPQTLTSYESDNYPQTLNTVNCFLAYLHTCAWFICIPVIPFKMGRDSSEVTEWTVLLVTHSGHLAGRLVYGSSLDDGLAVRPRATPVSSDVFSRHMYSASPVRATSRRSSRPSDCRNTPVFLHLSWQLPQKVFLPAGHYLIRMASSDLRSTCQGGILSLTPIIPLSALLVIHSTSNCI